MIPIYIPTRGRADYRFIQSHTLKFVPAAHRQFVKLVVREDEAVAYERALLRAGMEGFKLVVVPTKAKIEGIARKREWIGKYAKQQGQAYFMMMDDDLRFFRRVTTIDTKLQYFDKDGQDWYQMMEAVETLLKKGIPSPGLKRPGRRKAYIVGIGVREGNNRHGPGDAEELTRWNTRLCRAWAVDTEEFLACEHGRLSGMGDFDVMLQTLRRGLDIASLDYWAQDQDSTQAAGGCSIWRTHATHEASAKGLAAAHPGFVRLREKENKGGGEFGVRTEVTISWQKARESANA